MFTALPICMIMVVVLVDKVDNIHRQCHSSRSFTTELGLSITMCNV